MEQMRGRLAHMHRAKTAPEVVNAFARFQEALHFYRTVLGLLYDEAAAAQFGRLRQTHTHRGTSTEPAPRVPPGGLLPVQQ